ncbi:chemotaxis protein CheC [Nitrosopumilus ureiphilus]|uniref:Chemotaxis protein CheC n=1 Tax=Nitrosopumilus ureiphilus TaxID=1470067 RepID=A0A7D5RDP4_9ARCH|nr:chemotaxis protein CheC [Nitrosopumilus ureiphilus]QLH06861.1 chemotaxis protein CheC [Nitrosopumilus ureiphilus]
MNLQETEIQKLTGTFNDFITEKTCNALSTLLGEPIRHKLTMLENDVYSTETVCLPSDEIKMCSVRLNGKGDLHIELLYTTKLAHAVKIASKLLGTEVYEIDEMGTSALQEVANILTGSFFNALSENTGFRVDLSTPSFKEGELQDLLLEPACDVITPSNDAVITDSLLCGKNTGIEIHMLIIQHPEHARKLISPEAGNSKKIRYEDSSNTNLLGGENFAIDDLLANFDSKAKPSEENSEIECLLNGVSSQNEESNSEIDSLLKKFTEDNR